MMPDKYREEYIIPGYFIDCNRKLRPSSFFDIAQELALRGSAQLGIPDPVLNARGLCWILLRNSIHFERMPQKEEKVTLETWHSGIHGPISIRDYRMLDAGGEAIINATSSWGLMDIAARKLAKPERISDLLTPEPQCPERALEPDAPKVVFPEGCIKEDAGFHIVSWSDLDDNRHANNGKHPRWAMDCLPSEITTERTVTDLILNYSHEVRLGDKVQLFRAQGPDGAWYVEGLHDGLQSFICKIAFA
ncbi:MAG: hypothetical protein J5640_02290 [Bacteroidales bacterium]|nr:hypothetical protein [Bacteroidales bacterium]